MCNIAAKRCHIAHLRTGDQVTGFGQGLGVADCQRVTCDPVDWDGGTDKEFVTPLLEKSHLGDGCYVNKCYNR